MGRAKHVNHFGSNIGAPGVFSSSGDQAKSVDRTGTISTGNDTGSQAEASDRVGQVQQLPGRGSQGAQLSGVGKIPVLSPEEKVDRNNARISEIKQFASE